MLLHHLPGDDDEAGGRLSVGRTAHHSPGDGGVVCPSLLPDLAPSCLAKCRREDEGQNGAKMLSRASVHWLNTLHGPRCCLADDVKDLTGGEVFVEAVGEVLVSKSLKSCPAHHTTPHQTTPNIDFVDIVDRRAHQLESWERALEGGWRRRSMH